MVDDCHATGFMGDKGRGSYAHCGVEVDFVTGTFGKALGGAMGGFICATAPVVALLKQRARPYLFSNALSPAVCGSSLEAIRIAAGDEGDALRQQLFANAARYRAAMTEAGFDLLPGEHPIIPVMLGDARLAQDMAARMLSWASMSSASASRWCRAGPPASGPRCRPPTPSTRSIWWLKPSKPRARNWE